MALLDAIGRDGEITASQAAELLGESPGNMSWHLQTLAKYGFVEETGKGRGRSRQWRVSSESQSFETGLGDPDNAAAGDALERTLVERAYNPAGLDQRGQRNSGACRIQRIADRLLGGCCLTRLL